MADLKRWYEDFLNFIKLILSRKSKEEMQLEAIRYLTSHNGILHDFLRSMSVSFNKSSDEVDYVADMTLTFCSSLYDKDSNEGNIYKGKENSKIKPDTEAKLNEMTRQATENKKKNVDTSSDTSNGNRLTKKRRKSKYDDIQGDLSHICREPKRRKYMHRDNSKKDLSHQKNHQSHSKNNSERKNNQESSQMEKTKENNKQATVFNMVNTLLYSKSNTQRQEVLSSLRADPDLRDLFMKEKARLGKMKIPVFKDSNVQMTSDPDDLDVPKSGSSRRQLIGDSSTRAYEESQFEDNGTQYLIQLLQSVLSSKCLNTHHDNIDMDIDNFQLIKSDAALEGQNIAADKTDITADDTCTPFQDTSSLPSTIASNSLPFLHIQVMDRSSEEKVENFRSGSNREVFDDVLHEHFQELACEQYEENNSFIVGDNGSF